MSVEWQTVTTWVTGKERRYQVATYDRASHLRATEPS